MINTTVFIIVSILTSAVATAGSNNQVNEQAGLAMTEDFRQRFDEVKPRRFKEVEDLDSNEFWKSQIARILAGESLEHRFERLKSSLNYKRASAKARECFRLKQSVSNSQGEKSYVFYDTSIMCKNIRAKNNEYLQQRVAELQKKYSSSHSASEIKYLTDYYVGTLKQAQFFTNDSEDLLSALSAESKIPKKDFKTEMANISLILGIIVMDRAYDRHDAIAEKEREWLDPKLVGPKELIVPELERIAR